MQASREISIWVYRGWRNIYEADPEKESSEFRLWKHKEEIQAGNWESKP